MQSECRARVVVGCSLFVHKAVVDSYFFIRQVQVGSGGK